MLKQFGSAQILVWIQFRPGIHQPVLVLDSQVCDFQISININQEQLRALNLAQYLSFLFCFYPLNVLIIFV